MTTDCGCGSTGGSTCTCGGALPTSPEGNLPGQDALRWRVAPHDTALARMRAYLASPAHDLPVRSLASQPPADPAIALLDTWATVGDVVSFYTERLAQEGFLRTATETASVRQLARTLGYELRPGAAAQVELAFDVETAASAPLEVDVPAGTPVQSVPPPGALPQTFETTDDLLARVGWNAVPALAREPQSFRVDSGVVWLDTVAPLVAVDDRLLLVDPSARGDDPRAARPVPIFTDGWWAFRRVVAAEVDPPFAAGWTRLTLDSPVDLDGSGEVLVLRLARRLDLFGHNAPRPELLQDEDTRIAFVKTGGVEQLWPGWGVSGALEIEGVVRDLVPGSWLVLEGPADVQAFEATDVRHGGARRFGVAARTTVVEVDAPDRIAAFARDTTHVHAVSELLPTAWRPREAPVGAPVLAGTVLDVLPTVPPLEPGRRVLVCGTTTDDEPAVEAATVVGVVPLTGSAVPAGGAQRLVVDPPLAASYRPSTVVVRGNVADATHGETTAQVLGSGDGRVPFPRFALRKAPLTFTATTADPTGVVAALEVRVEDVAWDAVPTLHDAGPRDQVYVVRQGEDGTSTVVFGDGLHGARLPTGAENVTAGYRTGIGAAGAAEAGAVMLPVRRPRGIAAVSNPAPTHDWAPPEDLDSARVNAPQRIRTLDRAVSPADYADFARGYARVGAASAHVVWDGRTRTVVVSVLGATGDPATPTLVADLRATLDAAREQRARRVVLPGEVVDVGASFAVRVDPRHLVEDVTAAVTDAVLGAFGALDLATPLAASSVLVVAAGVPGVVAVTMPVLSAPGLADASDDLLVAAAARFEVPSGSPAGTGPRLLAAQALRLTAAGLDVEVIA
ncbi:hypothetical protein [Cellulomonas fimi]|uniref:hypothetical protein n=1 Tax=Cellulomonas fimi TaxID=1708 RepID=UPI00235952B3|nr:hypothetical protein [Cellulomonas fimi]